METPAITTRKPKIRRLHKETCGLTRLEHDDYADVLEACNRKLGQWEREGILLSPQAYYRNNDWLFGASPHRRRPCAPSAIDISPPKDQNGSEDQ